MFNKGSFLVRNENENEFLYNFTNRLILEKTRFISLYINNMSGFKQNYFRLKQNEWFKLSEEQFFWFQMTKTQFCKQIPD